MLRVLRSAVLLFLALLGPRALADEALARCMAEQGWVMYGSITCSGCRAQRKAFGEAFAHITEIECNPHIANNQVERCLDRKIGKMPTWILEKDGAEIKRIEGYQLLEDLAALTGCDG